MKKIIVRDETEFVPEKGSDGGSYAYETIYSFVRGKWYRKYTTSAEFEFCGVHGFFSSCTTCPFAEKCEGRVKVSEHEVLGDLLSAISSREYLVYLERDIPESPYWERIPIKDNAVLLMQYCKND